VGRKVIDVTNQKFGRLTVIEQDGKKSSGEKLWLCECECGGHKYATSTHLRQGRVHSCGCMAKENYGEKNPTWKGYKEIGSAFWGGYKRGADQRGFEFDILIKDGWKLFIKQNRKCFYSGKPIEFSKNTNKSRHGTASLERMDSSKGYSIDNCVWVHKNINKMKMDLSVEEFIRSNDAVTTNQHGDIK